MRCHALFKQSYLRQFLFDRKNKKTKLFVRKIPKFFICTLLYVSVVIFEILWKKSGFFKNLKFCFFFSCDFFEKYVFWSSQTDTIYQTLHNKVNSRRNTINFNFGGNGTYETHWFKRKNIRCSPYLQYSSLILRAKDF